HRHAGRRQGRAQHLPPSRQARIGDRHLAARQAGGPEGRDLRRGRRQRVAFGRGRSGAAGDPRGAAPLGGGARPRAHGLQRPHRQDRPHRRVIPDPAEAWASRARVGAMIEQPKATAPDTTDAPADPVDETDPATPDPSTPDPSTPGPSVSESSADDVTEVEVEVPEGHVLVIGPDGAPVGTVPASVVAQAQEGEGDGDDQSVTDLVEQPAKVMRIGSMIRQLLDEVKAAPLDEASRARLRDIHQASIKELETGLAPELIEELERIALPFTDDVTPSEGELRIAQAQLVG